jgi:hypothetical protein
VPPTGGKREKHTPRVTAAEVEQRVLRVSRLLINCASRSEISQFCKREYGVAQSQTDAYIKKARELIRQDCEVDRSDFLAARLGTLDLIIKESLRTGQHSNAIGALRLSLEVTGSMPKK